MPLPFAWIRRRLALCWLVAVAVGFAVAQVLLVPFDTFLSWDEAIYAGQFAQGIPHLMPSPHRAPGMAFLLAPVTLFTSSFTVVRAYLTVVVTVGLFLAYRCWLPVNKWVAPLAALLFAVTGQSMVLGHLALPNLPVALAAVATVAFFVRTKPVGVACTLGALAILRPTDAVFLSVVLGAAVVVARRWRRLDLLIAVPAGLAIGGVTWLVEAYVRFGSPLERLEATRSITSAGGQPVAMQWAHAVRDRAAESPRLALAAGAVALVAAVLVVLVVRKLSDGWPAPEWLLMLTAAAALVVPYYVLLSFTASRYLLPAKALLAVVCAAALVRVATAWTRVLRVFATSAVVIVVLLYAGTQVDSAVESASNLATVREVRESFAERIGARGIRPPCLVSGYQAPAFAYTLGCRANDNLSALPSTNNWSRELQRDWRIARQENVRFVAVLISEEPPPTVADWPRMRLGKSKPIYAYFAPTNP